MQIENNLISFSISRYECHRNWRKAKRVICCSYGIASGTQVKVEKYEHIVSVFVMALWCCCRYCWKLITMFLERFDVTYKAIKERCKCIFDLIKRAATNQLRLNSIPANTMQNDKRVNVSFSLISKWWNFKSTAQKCCSIY